MADIDRIKDFQGHWDRFLLTKVKPGDVVRNTPSAHRDGSVERAEAGLLYGRFGAVRDDDLGADCWEINWSDGDKPTLRLSPNLFDYVDRI